MTEEPEDSPDRRWKEVRLRLRADPGSLAVKAWHVRQFLARGHPVLLAHLLRARDALDESTLVAHYEHVAFELQGLAWRSSGPYRRADRVLVVFFPDRRPS